VLYKPKEVDPRKWFKSRGSFAFDHCIDTNSYIGPCRNNCKGCHLGSLIPFCTIRRHQDELADWNPPKELVEEALRVDDWLANNVNWLLREISEYRKGQMWYPETTNEYLERIHVCCSYLRLLAFYCLTEEQKKDRCTCHGFTFEGGSLWGKEETESWDEALNHWWNLEVLNRRPRPEIHGRMLEQA